MVILPIKTFRYGTIDSIEFEKVPRGAATTSLNWVTDSLKIALRRGYARLGLTENTGAGKITGLGVARKADGTEIPFRTRARKIEYYDSATDDWIEIGTDTLPATASGQEITFSSYFSLTGSQMFLNGVFLSGPMKIMVANPGSITNLAHTTNFGGYINAKQHRMWLWNRGGTIRDKTGLYASYVDKANLTDYTEITNEILGTGNGSNKTFTGTLAFKGAGARRTCFAVIISDGTESFQDDKNGVLVGSAGGTGTINYTTGAFSVTFAVAPAAVADNVKATSYYWEDSATAGVADFSSSSPRTVGQGLSLRQDDNGGNHQGIFSINNDIYCPHELKTWKVDTTLNDTNTTNLIFRNKVGIPNHRAAVDTGEGIYYVDDIDENNPQLRLLTFYSASTELIPKSISKALKLDGSFIGINLADYRFDQAAAIEYGDLIVFACRHKDSASNNIVFTYNKKNGALDKHDYYVSCFAIYNGTLIAGDSVTSNVYTLFSGLDDDAAVIANYWQGNLDNFDVNRLKAVHQLVIQGEIGPDQSIKVSISTDNSPFVEVRSQDDIDEGRSAITGSGNYVDRTQSVNVGSLTLGRGEIGGGSDGIVAYKYRRIIKLNLGNFEYAKIRFETTGIGYASVTEYRWHDIRKKYAHLPSQYQVQ